MTEWDWVDAAPFRAHLRHVMEVTGQPWRILALQAQVPCAVVRSLLYGRAGRPLRRIAPAYARALLQLTPASVHLSAAQVVGTRRSITLARSLLSHGFEIRQVAAMLGLSTRELLDVLAGRTNRVTLRVELAARAACLAHGLADPCRNELETEPSLEAYEPIAA